MVGTIMSGILFNATKIKGRETASIEVNDQLNFALESIQRAVMDSSVIDITPGTSTSTLILKYKNEAQNPTKFYIASGMLYEQVAANDPQPITSTSVVANAVNFLKVSGYTGHDSVQVDLTLSYNTASSSQDFAFTRSLSSAIARVNAATFDSNLIPGSDQFYDIGQTSARWNNMYLSGNLGIGTTNPAGPLDVNGKLTVLSSGNVGIGTTAPLEQLSVHLATDKNFHVRQGSSLGSSVTGVGLDSLNDSQNTIQAFSIRGNPIILNGVGNGNVGIGTTAPGTSLAIGDGTGTRAITLNGATYGSQALLFDQASTEVGRIWFNAGTDMIFATGGNNEKMRITSGGNIGIGTTNPSQKLDVAGSMNLGGYLIMPTGGYSIKLAGDNSGLTIVGASSNATGASISLLGHTNTMPDTITFNRSNGANSLESMRIDNNGNVGIGTTNPTHALDIVRSDNATWVGHFINSNTSGSSYGVEIDTNSATGMALQIYRQDITSPLLIVQNSGNVLKPSNSAFEAKYCGPTAYSAGSYIVWETVLSNIGSNYSATTGLYTAPVAGTYVFGFNTLMNQTGTGEYRYEFWKNGALYDSIIETKPAAGWDTIQGTISTKLNAGDTMGIHYTTGTGATYTDCGYDRFWGYLQG